MVSHNVLKSMKDFSLSGVRHILISTLVEALSKTEGICTFNEAIHDILHLREFHKQIDETVLKAYGWQDINLAHDFYKVDYLPENDVYDTQSHLKPEKLVGWVEERNPTIMTLMKGGTI